MKRAHMLTAVLLGMVLANFIYAALFDMPYVRAFDRSFFQGTALLTVWILDRIIGQGDVA